jgi:elongation factor Ts
MAAITAAAVKELRETTGAGMMDCKAALVETDGDMQAAIRLPAHQGAGPRRQEGKPRGCRRACRHRCRDGTQAAMIELNSETDFVARNEQFQALVAGVANTALGTDGSLKLCSRQRLADDW